MKARLLLLLVAAAFQTCTGKGSEGDDPTPRQILVSITSAAGHGSWKKGDSVSLIDASGNHLFSTGSEGESVMFSGMAEENVRERFAVFPYAEDLASDNGLVTIGIPSVQRSFEPWYAAFSTNSSFRLQPVSSGIRFRLATDNVESVRIEAGAAIAGDVILSKSIAGTLGISTKASSSSITILPALGQKTLQNADIFAGCLPGADTDMLKISVQGENGFDFILNEKISLRTGSVIDLGIIGEEDIRSDEIPDFSRVGYHWGDDPVPDIPVKVSLSAPSDGSDARAMIQAAIDAVETPGAVLLKAGKYNVSDVLHIKRSGVVLRGEGESTVLYCTSQKQIPTLVKVGGDSSPVYGESSEIVASYVAVGQMWVPVQEPEKFAPGDRVFIYRPATDAWLDAIHMREIAQNSSNSVVQWKASEYGMYWERKIMAVEGRKIWLDNPVVMCIGGDGFGTGILYKGSRERISECGVEYLAMDTRYDPGKKNGSDFIDENHCWSALTFASAEHSWARGVVTRHFGYSCVSLDEGAKNITVSACRSYSPVATIDGSRRYAFNMRHCQLCLVQDCFCDDDRHQFVTGARLSGPNVFLRCTATNARNDAGPHQRWATGTLYDNVTVDGALNIQDRAGYGTGHGWTAVNFVCWNCSAKTICVQSPWATGQNWAIGCIGRKVAAARSYSDRLGARPDGIWQSAGVKTNPESLYESQLNDRKSKGVRIAD